MIKKHIQLGSRPEEIRPVGAWVLPEECTNYATFDAVVSIILVIIIISLI